MGLEVVFVSRREREVDASGRLAWWYGILVRWRCEACLVVGRFRSEVLEAVWAVGSDKIVDQRSRGPIGADLAWLSLGFESTFPGSLTAQRHIGYWCLAD